MNRAVPMFAAARLALVLGSGGVKSVAGLGVAQVLQEEGMQPDLVVGCSAGALFGALLAMGKDAADCAHLATSLWSREVTSRKRHRAWAELALSGMTGKDNHAFGERFALRDDALILERLEAAFGDARIEDLPIPLVINATDARTGQAVLLHSGRLVEALRASIALPFLFAPQRLGGQWLVDGSVSDPLPVAAAAQAQATLAVGFPVPLPRRVNGPTRLATRITASLTNNLMQAHLSAHAGPRLHTLLPQLERRVGLFDTDAMPELIALGRRCAQGALPQLRALWAQGETNARAA
jgi:NTE family protein